MDKNSPFYECSPSEFLFLEIYAFLICTDSFHSNTKLKLKNRKYNRKNIIKESIQSGL